MQIYYLKIILIQPEYWLWIICLGGEYTINAEKEINNIGSFFGSEKYSPDSSLNELDTILLIPSKKSLSINEIYTVGPPNNFHYFYDQYIELYNSSDSTMYLDGMVVCRMSSSVMGNVTYMFQFPGTPLTGREHPVDPKEFVVLAHDAYDHKGEIFNGNASIDLSEADWEFRNSKDYGDWDNPDVPNLDNVITGNTNDFYINLVSDVIILADGSDVEYINGLDSSSIIDGVEYSSNASHIKDIQNYIDRGFTGVGQQKYSGMSMERKKAGFDTDNSTLDFEIIEAPTVGYQHE